MADTGKRMSGRKLSGRTEGLAAKAGNASRRSSLPLRVYMASKAVTLCFLAMGAAVFAVAAAVSGVSPQLLLLFVLLYLLIIAAWLLVSFFIERRKTDKLEKLIGELPEKYLLAEVLPLPASPVEQRYFQVMREISRSAIGEVQRARRDKEEYCDYVERWIHEMKTPLTACSLILANGGDAKKLRPELKRADNLTESILYYARLRTTEKDIKIRKFDVRRAMDEAVKSQMELMIAAKMRVETEGGFFVYSDYNALCFMLKQLLINAAKYCPGCRVWLSAQDGVITVEDNGIGIPSHEVSRVTQRGFTGTNGRRLGGSTGMGLFIVKELCGRLDMDMKVESVQGAYTKIRFVFQDSACGDG